MASPSPKSPRFARIRNLAERLRFGGAKEKRLSKHEDQPEGNDQRKSQPEQEKNQASLHELNEGPVVKPHTPREAQRKLEELREAVGKQGKEEPEPSRVSACSIIDCLLQRCKAEGMGMPACSTADAAPEQCLSFVKHLAHAGVRLLVYGHAELHATHHCHWKGCSHACAAGLE
jgi:hypothetical protein